MADLIPLDKKQPKDLFISGGLDPLLEAVEQEALALTLSADPNTKKGQNLLKSTARKVASSKTAIDAVGKEYVADAKDKIKSVDKERKRARDFLDDLRDKIRQPVTDLENAEKARVQGHKDRIKDIVSTREGLYGFSLEYLNKIKESTSLVMDYDFEEFSEEAEAEYTKTEAAIVEAIEKREELEEAKRIAEQARVEAEVQRRLREEEKKERSVDHGDVYQDVQHQQQETERAPRKTLEDELGHSPLEHKRQVNRTAMENISSVIGEWVEDKESADAIAQDVVKAIARNEIPNVQVIY